MAEAESVAKSESQIVDERKDKLNKWFDKYRVYILMIFLICALLFFFYVYLHIQAIVNDPCDICINQTGAQCIRLQDATNFKEVYG